MKSVIVLSLLAVIGSNLYGQDFVPLTLSLDQPATSSTAPTSAPAEHLNFLEHFSEYEPMYFVAGTDRPTAKYQISFKYRVFNPDGDWSQAFHPLSGFYLAYSQTSFWDLAGNSSPFVDSSYRPGVFLLYDRLVGSEPKAKHPWRLGVQTGYEHESNGMSGVDSRSMNTLYVQPIAVVGDERDFFASVAPRVFGYIGDLQDNPDIKDYRGNVSIRGVVGWYEWLQLAAVGRIGDDWDKGSLQLDLSIPLHSLIRKPHHNLDVNLHLQFFTGYGESLIHYNESDNTFRVGISFVR